MELFDAIFTTSIMTAVAMIMIGIGIYQLKSEKPVGFYTGVEPPKPEELTDVRAWNLKHGLGMVIYGCIMILTSVLAVFIAGGVWCPVLLMGGVLLPIPAMLWWHRYLVKRYVK